jgi:hypothetical protein
MHCGKSHDTETPEYRNGGEIASPASLVLPLVRRDIQAAIPVDRGYGLVR